MDEILHHQKIEPMWVHTMGFRNCGFLLRRLAQSSVCDDSSVRALFEAKRGFIRDRRPGSDHGFGGSKQEFTWQVQGIGHFVKVAAGAVFCVIRRIAFHMVGAGDSHHGSCVLRSKGSIPAFLELQLGDAVPWPAQHFVWLRVMISWQAQYFWNIFPKCEPFVEIARVNSRRML